jgi:hypothetical protein
MKRILLLYKVLTYRKRARERRKREGRKVILHTDPIITLFTYSSSIDASPTKV